MNGAITELYKSSKTVFTGKDLSLIWQETDPDALKSKIAYYIKQGDLIRLSRGVFAKDKNYNVKELAASIYKPSYISFETVLREKGVVFQHYESIFVAGPWPRTKTIDQTKIVFKKLKEEVLFSPEGINHKDNYSVASLERAFLDTIYLSPQYYFDNLQSIDWDKCFHLVKIYHNKQLIKRLRRYQKNAQ